MTVRGKGLSELGEWRGEQPGRRVLLRGVRQLCKQDDTNFEKLEHQCR